MSTPLRESLRGSWLLLLLTCITVTERRAAADIYLGSGAKTGEITCRSAIVHVRLTATAGQDDKGLIPGCEGQVRIRYGLQNRTADTVTEWCTAKADRDFSVQFRLTDLQANERYRYSIEYRQSDQSDLQRSDPFSFLTAPKPDVRTAVKFQVTTGQDLRGADAYLAMAAQQPAFLVSTGDNVYYDGPPNAHDVAGAYKAYQMMYGLPQMIEYFRHVGGYFQKDDHDYRFNDADRWQQVKGGDGGKRAKKKKTAKEQWLSHDEGIMVFKQVFPMSSPTYRTFRWGKGVQIWLVEGRDYRSPNNLPDGPEKSLWGKPQLDWLQTTLLESDADWRVLVSPTPIIGPDRVTKTDNHANPNGFWTEGQAFLDWIKDAGIKNLVLICGDRHWQYHSIDERHGRHIHEFSCGPTCDEHTQKVPPIEGPFDGVTQPYTGSRGGFLTAEYSPDGSLRFEFYDEEGSRVYQSSFPHGE